MRFIYLSIFFFSLFNYAQNTELKVTIDSIGSKDINSNKREFTVYYQIENKTDSIVSFILNTNSLKSNFVNSLSWTPAYKLHQEQTLIIAESINLARENDDTLYEKLKKEILLNKGNLESYFLKKQQEFLAESSSNIVKNIIKLNPHEKKQYANSILWDKNRYVLYENNEYYLDQKSTHYLDLHINLYKAALYQRLLPADLLSIKENKSIVEGWIASNKMEINFKD